MKIATPGLPPGADADTEALIQEARRRQHRRYLLTGLAAAMLLAGAAGVTLGQLRPGGRAPSHAFLSFPLAGAPARYSSAPAYYAYTVQGDIYNYVSHGTQYSSSADRYIKIRATATGKLLATIGPPRPYNAVGPLTAGADGRTFVFGARRIWQRNAGPSPKLAERDLRTPMKFLLLHITPQGHLQRAVLSLPDTMTPMQRPSIALSPDGTRLAVAFGGRGHTAAIQVITLTSGQVRQWAQPHSPWTPLLNGEGAWTADGQTLAFEQQLITPPRPLKRYTLPATTQMRLLDITARGTSLAASKLLVLRPPAGESAPAQPFLTPDGTTLIGPVGSKRFPETPNHPSTGQLAAYSARTGALLRTLAPWVWRWPSPPGRGGNPNQTIAWSNRSGSQLIILQPRDDLNILGVLTKNTFTQTARKLLPQQPSGYQALQYALRIAPQMTW
jgi:hypothetical protein